MALAVENYDVVIVGGGPGGLGVSQQLGARYISNVVLERGERAGWMWEHTYDSLRLHTGKHLSSMPGMAFPAGTSMFPTRLELVRYLEVYVDRFGLPVRTGVEATGLSRDADGWVIEVAAGVFRAKTVIVATGIMSSPFLPAFEGLASYEGQVMHSTRYRRPDKVPGSSVLVVGIGNSAAEIASELAGAGKEVAVSVRSGANVIPRRVAGIPSQYLGWAMGWLPPGLQRHIVRGTGMAGGLLRRGPSELPRKRMVNPCNDQPVIGNTILGHIKSGRVRVVPGIEEFGTDCVRFSDRSEWGGDAVILATGYRPAMHWMGDYADRDECGFGDRRDRVRSVHHSDLYFVGHNYDGRGGLYNIRIDAQRIARLIDRAHRQW